ncbi:MAG: hypothetical protein ACLURV_11205 [Gallintestinimicrobium sp.]
MFCLYILEEGGELLNRAAGEDSARVCKKALERERFENSKKERRRRKVFRSLRSFLLM